jgi:hypothetical protein
VRESGNSEGVMLKFSTFVDLPDAMNHANLLLNMKTFLQAAGEQKRGFPFELPMGLTTFSAQPRWPVMNCYDVKCLCSIVQSDQR